jgi:hypothetical protein
MGKPGGENHNAGLERAARRGERGAKAIPAAAKAGRIFQLLAARLNRLRKKVEESAKTVPAAAKADRFFKQLRHD